MKSTVLILISVLMAVFGTLSVISSGYDYTAEKLFYRAMRISARAQVNPEAVLPEALRTAEGNLRKIVEEYPQSKTAKDAHLALADFYLYNEKYEQALSILYDIINAYPQDKSVLSKAYFLRGNVFEKQNQWEKALREYTVLRDKYIDTPLALWVPLHLGQYYEEKGKYAQARQAYHQAALFYREIEREKRGSARGYAAANLLINTYMELEEYEQAGKIVKDTINNYPKILPLTQQLANIDLIFIKKLNKSEKAIELYKRMKTKTAEPNLTRILDEKIKALEARR